MKGQGISLPLITHTCIFLIRKGSGVSQFEQSRMMMGLKSFEKQGRSPRCVVVIFLLAIFLVALILSCLDNHTFIINTSMTSTKTNATTAVHNFIFPSNISVTPLPFKNVTKPSPPPLPKVIPFSCPIKNQSKTYRCQSQSLQITAIHTQSLSCPNYFRWIHEDLRPWKTTGITEEMVERARRTATFRLTIINGRVYVERFHKSFQSRDVFTLWGIVQLLRRYPGRVPDLDLMFDCADWPVVSARFYRGRNKPAPPPLFRYSADESTLDIVFPDWSFWGWPEINIKPWEALLEELKKGNKRVKWMNREPYAYWKGNPAVASTRMELLSCNVSADKDWNARIYAQDWFSETRTGFKQSNMASQCVHRYKIYIEGSAWSVSEKYILACDSPTLFVTPRYYDFFTRGLMPVHHYWPIRNDDKCRSIKFAVNWGNSHKQKAQAIGKEGSKFIQENLTMDHVYDYMFHLLNEYSKLLSYKPAKPQNAVEICAESIACPTRETKRKFMMESMVKAPRSSSPCSLPPPYSAAELLRIERRKANSKKQVELWEQKA